MFDLERIELSSTVNEVAEVEGVLQVGIFPACRGADEVGHDGAKAVADRAGEGALSRVVVVCRFDARQAEKGHHRERSRVRSNEKELDELDGTAERG